MVNNILKWNDKKFNKLQEDIKEGTDKHWIAKSFGHGFLEGTINGLVITGIMTIVVGGVVTVLNTIQKDEA